MNKIPELYISEHDKLESVMEMQHVLGKQMKEDIKSGKIPAVKNTLVSFMNETLSEPRSGSLHGVSKTIDILIDGYSKQTNFFSTLAAISTNNYTTAIHSINVCAMTLGICFYMGYKDYEIKEIGLAAMLHDTGKIYIPDKILNASRRLTSDEFNIIKKHAFQGYKILKSSRFNEKIYQVAYQHHEKLNGTGYPRGLKSNNIDKASQLVGLVDFYEAITNHDRAYRRAEAPIDAFAIIRECVDKGELNSNIFETMVQYLCD
ncbi:MAG: HD-GYP domain-containing protein [Planctomycetota bacterium]